MFVLRKVFKDGVESNTCIGNSYIVVDKEKSLEEFNRSFDVFGYDNYDLIYGFISYDEGKEVIPLYNTQKNYIMNGNGGLFANIKYHG